MRRVGILQEEEQAKRFSEYLELQGIKNQIEETEEGWPVWVYDEDQVPKAREEFEEFQQNPDAEKFHVEVDLARRFREELSEQTRQLEKAGRRRQQYQRRQELPFARRCPITFSLMAISIVVALMTNLGSQWSPVLDKLLIQKVQITGNSVMWPTGLTAVREGEIWRLVTPIFVHFGILHIAFNLWMVWVLGTPVELIEGSFKMLLLVLTIAIPSNVCQYYYTGPLFGGLSGVLYGLFGFIWIKSRFDPLAGYIMPSDMIFWLLGWFVLCLVGIIPHAANVVHAVGLGVGMVAGFLSAQRSRAA